MAVQEFMRLEDIQDELKKDLVFITRALAVLSKIDSQSTYTVFSAVSGILNHWAVNRDLNYYSRKRIIDDVAALSVYSVDDDYGKGIKAIESDIEIKPQELAKLLLIKGFDLPSFLSDKSLTPAKEEISDKADFKYGVAKTLLINSGVGNSEVNWTHWLTLPKWTPEQAVWLLYEIDPNAVLQPLMPLPLPLQELLQHAKPRGDMSPHQWKQFGVEQELQWSMPRQLREIQEPVIEAVNLKLLSEGLNKHLSHLEIVSLWIDTKEHRNVTNHYRETIHQAFLDEESVQYDEKLTKTIKDNHELKDRHLKAINQAVADGDLKAEISVSHSGRVGSWEVIPYSPTMLREVQGDTGVYQGREVYVQHMINRDDFRAWLEKTHQWPIPDDWSLSQWFEAKTQAETNLDTDNAKQSSFPADWKNDPGLAKLQKQHWAILEVIEVKNFDPMKIPDGEKETIRQICEADYPLLFDGSSSFDNAWKKGRHLFRMANHASFAKRGRQ